MMELRNINHSRGALDVGWSSIATNGFYEGPGWAFHFFGFRITANHFFHLPILVWLLLKMQDNLENV